MKHKAIGRTSNKSSLKRDLATIYLLNDVFQRIASDYRHSVMGAIGGLDKTIRDLRQDLTLGVATSEAIIEVLDRAEKFVQAIGTKTRHFSGEFPDFVWYHDLDLDQILDAQISMFRIYVVAGRIILKKDYRASQRTVFGSALMGEHIFNILNNSRQAIEELTARKHIDVGRIQVLVEDLASRSSKSRKVPFVKITITDNGGGVPKKNLSKVGQYGFTTKPTHGTGYGLAAARSYFESIGGSLAFRNQGDGFEVTIHVPVYSKALHGGQAIPLGLTLEKKAP